MLRREFLKRATLALEGIKLGADVVERRFNVESRGGIYVATNHDLWGAGPTPVHQLWGGDHTHLEEICDACKRREGDGRCSPVMQVEQPAVTQPAPPVADRTKTQRVAGGFYPTRGAWWSVGPTWNASRSVVLNHMIRTHGRGLSADWLRSLDRAELHSLHSDLHEGKIRRIYVGSTDANRPRSKRAPQSSRNTIRVRSVFKRRGRALCPT